MNKKLMYCKKEVAMPCLESELHEASGQKTSWFKSKMKYLSVLLLFSLIMALSFGDLRAQSFSVAVQDNPTDEIIVQGDTVQFRAAGIITLGAANAFTLTMNDGMPAGRWEIVRMRIKGVSGPGVSVNQQVFNSSTLSFTHPGGMSTYEIEVAVRGLCGLTNGATLNYKLTQVSTTASVTGKTAPIYDIAKPIMVYSVPPSVWASVNKPASRIFRVEESREDAYVSNFFLEATGNTTDFVVDSVLVSRSDLMTSPVKVAVSIVGGKYVYSVTSANLLTLGFTNGRMGFREPLYIKEFFHITRCWLDDVSYKGYFSASSTFSSSACEAFGPIELEVYHNIDGISPEIKMIEQIDPSSNNSLTGKFIYKVSNWSDCLYCILDDIEVETKFENDGAYSPYFYGQGYLSDASGNIISGANKIGSATPDRERTYRFADFRGPDAIYTSRGLIKEGLGFPSLDRNRTVYFTVEWGVDITKDVNGNPVTCATDTLYDRITQRGLLSYLNPCGVRDWTELGVPDEDATVRYMRDFIVPTPYVSIDEPNMIGTGPHTRTFTFYEIATEGYAANKDNPAIEHYVYFTFPIDFKWEPGISQVTVRGVVYVDGTPDMQVNAATRTIKIRLPDRVKSSRISVTLRNDPLRTPCGFDERVVILKHTVKFGSMAEMDYACSTRPIPYVWQLGAGGGAGVVSIPEVTRLSWGYIDDANDGFGIGTYGRIIDSTGHNIRYALGGPYDKSVITIDGGISGNLTVNKLTDTAYINLGYYMPGGATREYFKTDSIFLTYTDGLTGITTRQFIPASLVESYYTVPPDNSFALTDVPNFKEYRLNIIDFLPDLLRAGSTYKIEYYTLMNEDDLTKYISALQYFGCNTDFRLAAHPTLRPSNFMLSKFAATNYKLDQIGLWNEGSHHDRNLPGRSELFRYILSVPHSEEGERFTKEIRPNTEIENLKITFNSTIVIDSLWVINSENPDDSLRFEPYYFSPSDYTVSYDNGATIVQLNRKVANEVWSFRTGYIFYGVWRTVCWADSELKVEFDAIHFSTSEKPQRESIVRYLDMKLPGDDYDYKVYSDAALIRPVADTLSWKVRISNKSRWSGDDSKLYHSWLAFEIPEGGVTPVSLKGKSSSASTYTTYPIVNLQPYGINKFWIKVDTLEFNDSYEFCIDAIYNQCDEKEYQVKVMFGSNYVTYPTNPDEGFSQYGLTGGGDCPKIESTILKYKPYKLNIHSRIDLTLVAPDAYTMCDSVGFTLTVANANESILKNVTVLIPNNENNKGITWNPAGVMFSQGHGVTPTKALFSAAGGVATITPEGLLITLTPGRELGPYDRSDYKMTFKVMGMLACDFDAGQELDVVVKATPGCNLPQIENVRSQRIELTTMLSQTLTDFTVDAPEIAQIMSVISGSGSVSFPVTYTANLGYVDPNQYAYIVIPEGWTLTGSPAFTLRPGTTNVYTAPITMAFSVFNITLSANNPALLDCQDYPVIIRSAVMSSLTCGITTCNSFRLHSDRKEVTITVEKKNLTLENVVFTGSYQNTTTEVVNLAYTIRNNGTAPVSRPTSIRLYVDQTNNGLSADDILFATYAVPTGPYIAVGGTVALSQANIQIPANQVCKMLVVLSDPTMCDSDVVVPTKNYTVATPLAGTGCQGSLITPTPTLPLITGYTYTWILSPANSDVILDQTNVAQPKITYLSSANITGTQTVRLDLQVVRSVGGCVSTATNAASFTVNPLHKLNILSGDTDQIGCSGDFQNIQYQLGGGATGATFNVVPANALVNNTASGTISKGSAFTSNHIITYTLTTTGTSCSPITITGTIIQKRLPVIAALDHQTICSGSTINVTPTITERETTITSYRWYYGGTQVGTAKNLTYTPSVADSLQLVVTTECGTVYSNKVKISIFNVTDNKITTYDADVCIGSYTTIVAPPLVGAGITYTWEAKNFHTGTWTVVGNSQNYTTVPRTTADTTLYRRTVYLPVCGNQVGDTAQVITHAIAGVNAIYKDSIICKGANIIITGEPLTGGTYDWQYSTTGATWSDFGPIITTQDLTVTGLTADSIKYRRVFDTGVCLANSNVVTIKTFDNAINIITTNDTTVCHNADIELIASDIKAVFPTATYQWQIETASVWSNIVGANTKNYTALNLTQNTRYRRIVSVGGCTGQFSNIIDVKVFNNAVANIIAVDPSLDTICRGSNSFIDGNTITGFSSIVYQWQSSLDGVTFSGSLAATEDYTPIGLTTTTYFRRLVNVGGCEGISNIDSVHVSQPISILGPTPNSIEVCSSLDSLILPDYTISNYSDFVWTIQSGKGTLSDPTALKPTYRFFDDNADTTVLRLMVTPISPCLMDSVDYTIIVQPEIKYTITDKTPAICATDVIYTMAGNTVANGAPNWTTTGIGPFLGGGSNNINISYGVVSGEPSPIKFFLEIVPLATNNTCPTLNDSVILTLTTPPTIAPIADVLYCDGDSIGIDFVLTGVGATVDWAATNDFGAGISGTTATEISTYAVNNTSGMLNSTVTVTPKIGTCAGVPTSFVVSVMPNLALTSAADVAICNGVNVNYTATSGAAGAIYIWRRDALPTDVTTTHIKGDGAIADTTATISEILTNATDTVVTIEYFYDVLFVNGTDTCRVNDQKVVVNVAPELAITNIADAIICSGTPFTFTPVYNIVTKPAMLVKWERAYNAGINEAPTSGSSLLGTEAINEVLTNKLASGDVTASYTYWLGYPNPNGIDTCWTTYNFNVVVRQSFTLSPLGALNQTICDGQTITNIVFTTNNPAGVGLTDTLAGNFILTPGSGIVTLSSNALTAGVYTYTVFIENCLGDSTKYSGIITVGATPVLTTPIADIDICVGGSVTREAIISSPLPVTYKWTYLGTTTVLSTTSTLNYTGVLADDGKKILLEVANTCTTLYDTINITVSSTLNDIGSGIAYYSFCDTLLTPIALPGGTSTSTAAYQWLSSTDNVVYTPIALATSNSYIIPAGSINATTYYRRVLITTGCGSDTSTTVVTVEKLLSTPVKIVGDTDVCVNSIIDLDEASNIGPGTWSSMNTAIATVDNNGVVTGVKAGTTGIIYTYTNGSGCPSSDTMTVNIRPLPVASATPAYGYMPVGGTNKIVINRNATDTIKSVTINNPTIAGFVLDNDTITVTGLQSGNTEILVVIKSQYNCESTLMIPIQVEGPPTGILIGKDIIKCNVPGGGDTTIVQIAYIMGGVSPWLVTVSDDRGLFSKDTLINSIDDLPVNVVVTIPENMTDVPEFTSYAITYIEDALGSIKYTHYNTVRVGTNPTPRIDTIANSDQVVCHGAMTLPISYSGVATNYRWHIDKNIGQINYLEDGIPSFVAINTTTDSITATIVVIPEYWYNGVVCIGEPDTARITVVPSIIADFTWEVTGLGEMTFTGITIPGATYEWNFGDATSGSGQIVDHKYAQAGSYDITLTITSPDGCVATITKTIFVNTATDIAAKFDINMDVQCVLGNLFEFTNLSTISTLNHSIDYCHWDFGDGKDSITGNVALITHVYDTTGVYTVTLTVYDTIGGTHATATGTIRVIAKPIVEIVAPATVCSGEKLQITNPVIDWRGNTPVAGTWLLDGKIFTPSVDVLTYADNGKVLTYHVTSLCGDTLSNAVPIAVNPAVESGAISSTGEIVCIGTAPTMTITELTAASGGSGVYRYQWRVNGNLITGATAATYLPKLADINGGMIAGTYTFTREVSDSICGSYMASNNSWQLIVLPAATVAQVDDQVHCAGTIPAIPFNGTATNYRWVIGGDSIGLNSGSGMMIPSFTAVNTTGGVLVATIAVTPEYIYGIDTCYGAVMNFSIHILPVSKVDFVPEQIYCHGTTAPVYEFTGSPAGAHFEWRRLSGHDFGLSAVTGVDSIPSFLANNLGNSPLQATYEVVPVYTHLGISCYGASQTFMITVNPKPMVYPIANQIFCEGLTTAIPLVGDVSGTIYKWIGGSAIGLADGQSSIEIPSFKATAGTATIQVVPNKIGSGLCSGDTVTFTITINPTPVVLNAQDFVYCDEEQAPKFIFTGTPAGAHFAWNRVIGEDIGLGEDNWSNSGIDSIPAFVAKNKLGISLIATYIVTPYYEENGLRCNGVPELFLITVNPIPSMDTVMNMVYCHGTQTPIYTFTSDLPDGVNYIWTRTSLTPSTATVAGLPEVGNDIFPSFLAVNTGDVDIVAEYEVYPEYRFANKPCTGAVQTFKVIIHPVAKLDNAAPISICSGDSVRYVLTGTATASISWYREPNIGIEEASISGTGTILDKLTNQTNDIVNVRYVVTLSTGVCDYTEYIHVSVAPRIDISNTFGDMTATACSGEEFATTLRSNVNGTTFTWARLANAAVQEPVSAGTTAEIREVLTNLTNAPVAVRYAVVGTANGCTKEDTLVVTLNPKLTLTSPTAIAALCSGEELIYGITSTPAASYRWTRLFNANVTPHSNYGAGSHIYETIVNDSDVDQVVTYVITMELNGCQDTAMVTGVIKPSPKATLESSDVTMAYGAQMNVAITSGANANSTVVSANPTIVGATLNASRDAVVLNALEEGTTTVTYSVTENGCTSIFELRVTVSRTPIGTLELGAGGNVLCSGGSTELKITDILYGVAPWTVVLTNTASPAWTQTVTIDRRGDLPKRVNITLPANASPGIATYYYSIDSVTDANGSVGTAHSGGVMIEVLPAPKVDPVPANQVLCNNTMSDAVYFQGVATVYNWVVDRNIGLQLQGSGNIPSFNAINNTTASITATVTVTPEYRYKDKVCTGAESTFTITVHPKVTMQAVNDTTVCADEDVTIALGGATNYRWDAVPAIGLPAGTGTAIIFKAKNNGQSIISKEVVVIPINTYSGMDCEGTAISFVISVNPVPEIAQIADREYCDGEIVPIYAFNGNNRNATYTWERTGGAVINGLPNSGINEMPSFKAVNKGTTVIEAEYSVVAYYGNKGDGAVCESDVVTFKLRIYPELKVPAISVQAYCPEVDTDPIVLKEDPMSDITYYWTQVSGPYIGLTPSTGQDIIPSFITVNSSHTHAVTAVIEVIASRPGGYCNSQPYQFEITVHPTPVLPNLYISGDTIISIGERTTLVIETQVDGIFQWYADPTHLNFIQDGRHFTTPILDVTTSYYITMINAGGCESENHTKVTVHVGEHDLVIPGAITPNGDGYNDYWIIKNIDNFPKNHVTIVNRWGVKVFERTGYSNNNPWDCYPEGKMVLGNGMVPRGTYFYKIELNDGTGRIYTGFIEVVY